MPIHVRAEPGDYAEACLLPGDPLRAQYIAETFMDEPRQTNKERGMLGYTGTFRGQPVSVQVVGNGLSLRGDRDRRARAARRQADRFGSEPAAASSPTSQIGDLIVALSAVPADATATPLHGRRAARPDGGLGAPSLAVHAAKTLGKTVRVGPIVSSDVFYNPDTEQYEPLVVARRSSPSRWRRRALHAGGASQKIQTGCLLT